MSKLQRMILFQLLITACLVLALGSCGEKERPVVDREEMLNFLTDALNRYYADKGEYPDELVGQSGIAVFDSCAPLYPYDLDEGQGHSLFMMSSEKPDILQSEGYIRKYPLAYPNKNCPMHGEKSPRRWICAVTTAFTGRAEWGRPIRLTLGGISGTYPTLHNGKPTERSFEEYTLVPGHLDTSPIHSMSYFGYVRDDLEGGEQGTARVWVYGDLEGSKQVQDYLDKDTEFPRQTVYWDFAQILPLTGFDVLNARTGEIEPDGTPDGVCMIAWLKDGKVVDVKTYEPGEHQLDDTPEESPDEVSADAEESATP